MDKVDTVNEKPNEENTKEAPLPEVNQPKEINTDLNLQEVNQPKEINTDLNEEEKKNSILKNYSSIDFMTLEKINFDYESTEGKEKVSICPNGEVSKDEKEYYIFFNIDKNFKKLRDYYKMQLNNILRKHNYYLAYDKEELIKKSNSIILETKLTLVSPDNFRPFYSLLKSIGRTFKEKYFLNANIYASNCAILNSLLEDKVLSHQAITIEKELTSLVNRISSNNFFLIKKSYKEIMESEETDLNKVKNIENNLNKYISDYKNQKKENSKIELLFLYIKQIII